MEHKIQSIQKVGLNHSKQADPRRVVRQCNQLKQIAKPRQKGL